MEIENRDHLLDAIKWLSIKKTAPTREAILYTEFITKWEKDEQLLDTELDEMLSNGLIVQSDGVYSLTPAGRSLAQQNEARKFSQAMIAGEQSAAYRELCRQLYGSDRCQFDMMTPAQLDKLLDVLSLSKCQSILDLGCSTGDITEYLSDHTHGNVTGIDFSSEAIEFARKRTRKKRNRLSFQVMDMDEITFPPNSFDTIISVDTLYFVSDLQKTMNAIRDSLQEQGQMGIFYSSKISVGESQEMLRPENTVLAKTLEKCGLQFETWEYTAEEKELWAKCVNIANELKDQFVGEGNLFIYEEIISEATGESKLFDMERKSRYLYHAWL
jgi:ubiquinone/menaquinone biosynthesis C-methylase UbiE